MGKKVSKAGKGYFITYKVANVYGKNKRIKLERHLKLFPNDEKAAKCLESGNKHGFFYKRKKPKTNQWNHTNKHFAEMWKELGHSGTKYINYIKSKRVSAVKKEFNAK